MSIKKTYLVVPAYLAGIASTAAASQLLPQHIGLPIAAVFTIAMLSFFSLTHRALNGEITIHIVVWAIAIAIACGLAATVFAAIPGPTVSFMDNVTWWQLAFVVTQQVFYFGIHAFTSDH